MGTRNMLKIKKNDTVKVVSGKDAGKTGKVLATLHNEGRILIEGVNLLKKHMRRTKEDQRGGITAIEFPINLSNVMLVCRHCRKPAKVGFSILKDGSKARVCRKCKETL